MGKGNNVYDEMDGIVQRINQIEGSVWIGEGDKIKQKALSPKELNELEQLRARLQELKEQEGKSLVIE